MSKPRVVILMGSDSDLPVMSKASAVLDEFGVAHDMTIATCAPGHFAGIEGVTVEDWSA